MSKRYVIGDIHGCSKTLEKLLNELAPGSEDSIYFLGDYIDRGPDSKAVFDIIFELIESGNEIYALKGNHEDMLLKAIDSELYFKLWIKQNGGGTTLKNFQVKKPEDIPAKYLDFIKNTKSFIDLPDFVLVHGGMDFKRKNPFKNKEAMLWVRNDESEIDLEKTNNRPIIVGHTPVPQERIINSLSSKMIMLDGGCVYYRQRKALGYLAALELNSMELTLTLNCESS